MPFVLILSGALFIVVAINGTQKQLGTLIAGEFSGSNNFIYWIASLGIVGSIGYIPSLKPLSDSFIALLLVVLFLKRGGFWSQLNAALGGAAQQQTLQPQTDTLSQQPQTDTLSQQLQKSESAIQQELGSTYLPE